MCLMLRAMFQEELTYIAIDKITVNPFQPRRNFIQSDLEELASSILAVGLIHPPLVRPMGDHYELVSGERRFRAAQLAGLKSIPVVIRNQSDHISAQAALIENIQRVDLNPIDIAKALRSLLEQGHLNQEELAKRIGKKRSTVANYLRLLTLPQSIQDNVSAGHISMGHAKAILSIEGAERQCSLNDLIIKNELTVREAEETAQRMMCKHPVAQRHAIAPTPPVDCHLAAVASQIQQKLGTKVNIQGKDNHGVIHIEYYDLDDLERLMTILGIELN